MKNLTKKSHFFNTLIIQIISSFIIYKILQDASIYMAITTMPIIFILYEFIW
jgi:hypothetical protein